MAANHFRSVLCRRSVLCVGRHRYADATLTLEMGLNNHNSALELHHVSLCPMPSGAQMCYAAPRQVPQTLLQALEAGNSRTEAFSADGLLQVMAAPPPLRPPYPRPQQGILDGIGRPLHRRGWRWAQWKPTNLELLPQTDAMCQDARKREGQQSSGGLLECPPPPPRHPRVQVRGGFGEP